MPLDVLKTRMQAPGAAKQYTSIIDCAIKSVRAEGIGSLYRGVQPALLRQSVYGSLRYGLYAPIRNMIGVDANTPKSEIPFWAKFVAGGGAGALASFIANPTDLLKIRMQVAAMGPDAGKYKSLVGGFVTLVKEEGITGLWRGAAPNLARATTLAAVELSTYDTVKGKLIAEGLVEPGTIKGVGVSAFTTGFIASVASNPFDVVKTRMMGQPVGTDGHGTLYKNMLDCAQKSIKAEGIAVLAKGFLPCWARLGPRAMIIFQTMEFFNRKAG